MASAVALNDLLVKLDGSPIVRLNRALAVGERDSPEAGRALIDDLELALSGYHAYHAARVHLMRRLGRATTSRNAYNAAISLAGNTTEIAFVTRCRDQAQPEDHGRCG